MKGSAKVDLRLFCGATVAICVWLVSGCAARRSTAGQTQPPVAGPSETSPEIEPPKRNANAGGTPSPSSSSTTTSSKGTRSEGDVGRYTEEGNASWYGEPFNGRRASNGEIYDMHKLTAAHRTIPFNTMVRVTNLTNGKSTVVRITDRGPFVAGRVIDLSYAAAREIEMIGPGVAPVRLDVISQEVDPTEGFFTVQVGAFKDKANAEHLRERLGSDYSPIFMQTYNTPDGTFYRLRVGKVSGEEAARQLGEKLHRTEGFTTLVFRLDETGLDQAQP